MHVHDYLLASEVYIRPVRPDDPFVSYVPQGAYVALDFRGELQLFGCGVAVLKRRVKAEDLIPRYLN